MTTATNWIDPVPSIIEHELAEHAQIVKNLQLDTMFLFDLYRASSIIDAAFNNDHRVFLCGNGGSAADCQHLAAEFVVKFKGIRSPLSAIALTTDSSVLTAGGNDFGFETIFSRQIEAHGQPGDVLLAFSTSGKSPNVLKAIQQANDFAMKVIAFTGQAGIEADVDVCLKVPSSVTARIQEAHILMGHILCELAE